MKIRFLFQLVFLFLTIAAQAVVGGSFADENGCEQVIATTDEHPFWVVNKDAMVEAKDLQIGDTFLGTNGELSTLVEKERVYYPECINVYNFTVADNHNYFVVASLEAYQNGASVVLVHNAGCGVTSQINDRGLIRAAEKGIKNVGTHQNWSRKFNEKWSEFLSNPDNHTKEKILDFMEYMRKNYPPPTSP
jgi:hypothetical protein